MAESSVSTGGTPSAKEVVSSFKDSTTSTEHQMQSPFLHLPAELRDRIYHLALFKRELYCKTCNKWYKGRTVDEQLTKGNVVIVDNYYRSCCANDWSLSRRVVPRLLQVNRQIRQEAAAVFNRIHNFSVVILHEADFSGFHAWLDLLQDHSELIESITIVFLGELHTIDFLHFFEKFPQHLGAQCMINAAGCSDMVQHFHAGMKFAEHFMLNGLGWTQLQVILSKLNDVLEVTRHSDGEEKHDHACDSQIYPAHMSCPHESPHEQSETESSSEDDEDDEDDDDDEEDDDEEDDDEEDDDEEDDDEEDDDEEDDDEEDHEGADDDESEDDADGDDTIEDDTTDRGEDAGIHIATTEAKKADVIEDAA